MDEAGFWALIDSTAPPEGAGTDEHVERIVDALAARPDGDVVAFHTQLCTAAGRACHWDLWAVAYLAMGGCSDDSFDYFRMWLVAQGREYFERALAEPARAVDNLAPGDFAECESLDYAASEAWERSHETEFPYDEAEAAVPEHDVDIAGEPFDEDTVHERFPDVARRFGG